MAARVATAKKSKRRGIVQAIKTRGCDQVSCCLTTHSSPSSPRFVLEMKRSASSSIQQQQSKKRHLTFASEDGGTAGTSFSVFDHLKRLPLVHMMHKPCRQLFVSFPHAFVCSDVSFDNIGGKLVKNAKKIKTLLAAKKAAFVFAVKKRRNVCANFSRLKASCLSIFFFNFLSHRNCSTNSRILSL